jgi:hypothetical protein
MPDDGYELEKRFYAKLDEHNRKMATDEQYRKQWQAKQNEMLRPAVGALI